MWSFFTDLALKWGLPAILMIFWYLHSRDQNQLFRDMLQQHKQQSEQHFAQLQEMLGTLQMLGAGQARLEGKIDTNQSCPIVRRREG